MAVCAHCLLRSPGGIRDPGDDRREGDDLLLPRVPGDPRPPALRGVDRILRPTPRVDPRPSGERPGSARRVRRGRPHLGPTGRGRSRHLRYTVRLLRLAHRAVSRRATRHSLHARQFRHRQGPDLLESGRNGCRGRRPGDPRPRVHAVPPRIAPRRRRPSTGNVGPAAALRDRGVPLDAGDALHRGALRRVLPGDRRAVRAAFPVALFPPLHSGRLLLRRALLPRSPPRGAPRGVRDGRPRLPRGVLRVRLQHRVAVPRGRGVFRHGDDDPDPDPPWPVHRGGGEVPRGRRDLQARAAGARDGPEDRTGRRDGRRPRRLPFSRGSRGDRPRGADAGGREGDGRKFGGGRVDVDRGVGPRVENRGRSGRRRVTERDGTPPRSGRPDRRRDRPVPRRAGGGGGAGAKGADPAGGRSRGPLLRAGDPPHRRRDGSPRPSRGIPPPRRADGGDLGAGHRLPVRSRAGCAARRPRRDHLRAGARDPRPRGGRPRTGGKGTVRPVRQDRDAHPRAGPG